MCPYAEASGDGGTQVACAVCASARPFTGRAISPRTSYYFIRFPTVGYQYPVSALRQGASIRYGWDARRNDVRRL